MQVKALLNTGVKVLTQDEDYTVAYSDHDSKTTKVIVTGIGNYASEITVYYEHSDEVMDKAALPTGLTEIGEEAFAGTAFEIIVIPDGMKYIPAGTFTDMPNLKEISVPADCVVEDGACDESVTIERR